MSIVSDLLAMPEIEERPVIPPRSTLYCLEPVALGSGMVESLTSHISRLAAAHSFTISTLVRKIIAPLGTISTVKGTCGTHDLLGHASSAINGSGEISAQLVRILGPLTGRGDLKQLTMQFATGWVAAHSVISIRQKWCPHCLQQMRNSGVTIYYPLLWNLELSWICPEHEVDLVLNCPQCQKAHYPLCGRLVVGQCPHCSAWLGETAIESNLSGEDEVLRRGKLFCARQLTRIIAEAKRFPCGVPEGWRVNVKQLIEMQRNRSVNALAKKIGVTHDTVTMWMKGTQAPRLASLLMVAYALRVNVIDLISGELPKEITLNSPVPGNLFTQFLRRKLKRHDLKLVHERMKRAAENPGVAPPSLARLCKEIGCDPSCAARMFPELGDKIKAHYRTYVSIHKQQRQFFVGLITKCVASQLISSRQYPSYGQMKRALPSWITLRDPLARKAWLDVLEQWGWKGGHNGTSN